ncbi:SHOCT domain-containing protein [Streptomyces himalayensis]|nr:SHOCT domain-containing protein [Streptomyces himalayensis]
MDLLRQLGELRDAGIVTPEEFEAKKADLLRRL